VPESVRYVAVQYRPNPGRRLLMKAAIEDRRGEYVIPVVNALVAITLADLLNREERGEPLPESARTTTVAPFSAVNPDAGAGPPFFVIWSNSFDRRFMATTRTREDAERLARLLNCVDYPARTSAWRTIWAWPSVKREAKDAARLAEPTLPSTQVRERPR
jgi:hypothetical protein